MINVSQKAAIESKDNTRSQSILYSFSFATRNENPSLKVCAHMCLFKGRNLIRFEQW